MVWTARARLSVFALHSQRAVQRDRDSGGWGGGDCVHAGVGEEFLGCECGTLCPFQGVGYDVSLFDLFVSR